MGDKLGKMVNKVFSIAIIIFTLSLGAEENASLKKFDRLDQKVSMDKEARIFSITGSVNNISLLGVKVAKPSTQSLMRYGLISRKDKYAIKVLNDKGNQIMLVGLGDPFTMHIDHIGYEDETVFQADIPQNFEIAIPVTSNAAFFVLLSQDEFGFKEIKKIKVN
jgi:hypothetical protein